MAKTSVNLANVKLAVEQGVANLGNTAFERFPGNFVVVRENKSGSVTIALSATNQKDGLDPENAEDVTVTITRFEADFLAKQGWKSDYYVSHPYFPGTEKMDTSQNILRLDNDMSNGLAASGAKVSDFSKNALWKAEIMSDPTNPIAMVLKAKAILGNVQKPTRPQTLSEKLKEQARIELGAGEAGVKIS
jgi:hypothetical protein